MAYIVSHESASVEFPMWVRTVSGVTANKSVLIQGGADVINKVNETPKGIVTEVTDEELEFLQTQWLFQEKVKNGLYEVQKTEKKAKESAQVRKGKKDKGAQLTAKDFEEAGMTPPVVGANETPDDGSGLKD